MRDGDEEAAALQKLSECGHLHMSTLVILLSIKTTDRHTLFPEEGDGCDRDPPILSSRWSLSVPESKGRVKVIHIWKVCPLRMMKSSLW